MSAARRRSLRVRDPNGPLVKGFLGFAWFPIDLQYRVTGRFIKDAQPQQIKVLNTFGDVDEYNSEGVVEFSLLGQTLRLRPFTTRPKRFYFVFRDASSGQETYEAARFLYADLLDDGTTVLDFNQAYNPPCAFNPYTTCPIPIRENRSDQDSCRREGVSGACAATRRGEAIGAEHAGSNQSSTGRSLTVSPMTITAGAPRPALAMTSGSVQMVAMATRCRAHVPHSITAAGVSPLRPAASN